MVHLDDGVDFLGFNVRRYRGKLLIKPSTAAVQRIKARLSTEMRTLRGHNAQLVLIRLNPIIRGWSAYYRHFVSARVFNELDNHVWRLTYKWAQFTHPHKGKRWIVSRYFGAFNSSRRDRWVFGDRIAAPTWSNSLGRRSPGTPSSKVGRPRTTRCWPTTGRPGADAGHPRWTGPGHDCCTGNAGAARCAGSSCCTPMSSRDIPTSGSGGSPPPPRRSATTRSPSTRESQSHWVTPHSVSPTRTASAACQTALPVRQHSATPTDALQGLLEPVAWKAGMAGS